MENCIKCHYNDFDPENKECDKCYENYYWSNVTKTCKKCYYQRIINNGKCYICSDDQNDYNSSNCYCDYDYGFNQNKSCLKCGEDCRHCNIDLENNIECTSCYSGSALHEKNKNCLKCSSDCYNCIIIYDKETACRECSYHYFLKDYNNCSECLPECNTCIYDENNNHICTSCKDFCALSSDGKCECCTDGCNKCILNEKNNPICLSCYSDYADLLNINGTCKKCRSINDIGGDGCYRCGYNNDTLKYECYECYKSYYYDSDNYTLIINDKRCVLFNEVNLSKECLEVINIGTLDAPIYSCHKCSQYTAKITNLTNNVSDCYNRIDELIYCLEGESDDISKNCTKCVEHSQLNNNNNTCECDSDSFSKNKSFCYQCDDNIQGNPGCIASKGCEYKIVNDQLNCNECKSGYFQFTKGQCFSCSKEIEFCNICNIDLNNQIFCEECIANFTYNHEKKKCEKNWEENKNISSGCINFDGINIENNNNCLICKPYYFKTEDGLCMYCNQESYGGTHCDKCEYKNGKVMCTECNGFLNSEGKCYNCQNDLFDECESCDFKEGKLICTLCKPGYYLKDDNCKNYLDLLEKINNCNKYSYSIGNVYFNYYPETGYVNYDKFIYNNQSYYYYNLNDMNIDFIDFINKNINNNENKIKKGISGKCVYCNDEYYLNSEGNCEPLTLDKCILISMIDNSELYEKCTKFCSENKFPFILIDLHNISDIQEYYSISEAMNLYSNKFIIKYINLEEVPLCLNNSRLPSLNNCYKVLYPKEKDQYICKSCFQGYILNTSTNLCNEIKENKKEIPNCEYENIGTNKEPIYSCKACYNSNLYYSYTDYMLVKEGNISFCEEVNSLGLENCLEAEADTTYIRTKYNCKSCVINHLPYNSSFFGRVICHNIYEDIIRDKILDLTKFIEENDTVKAKNGTCDSKYFTPDGENCYSCSNENVGMPGCKGSCSFSLKRNEPIKCKECEEEEEYIESSEGVCEKCSNINKGCYKCHYDDYPSDYFGIKRKRRFVCDYCDDDYSKEDGICKHCSYYIPNCVKCKKNNDTILNNLFQCTKCELGYYLIGNECKYCNEENKVIIENNRCIYCNDKSNGGIEGCQYCETNNNSSPICRECEEGYILISDNNKCIKISEYNGVKQPNGCKEINKDHCSKCKNEYLTIFKNNNEEKCIYIPEFNSYSFEYFYYQYLHEYNSYNTIKEFVDDNNNIYDFYYVSDYFHYFYFNYESCQEVTNIGSEKNPLYSCTKCYNLFEYDKISYNRFVLIKDEKTGISFCAYSYIDPNLNNCIKANMKIDGDKIKFSCKECIKDYTKRNNDEDDLVYCSSVFTDSISKCMVKYCDKCQSNKNYYCETCFPSYQIVPLTGSCMKITEIEPTITWKDIFRLNLNSEKVINGRTIYGPTLWLRGITRQKINSRHAFLINLTFKVNQIKLLRNLEEEEETTIAKLETICEINKSIEEGTEDETIWLIDYECIGDNKDNLRLIELIKIEEADPNSNLNILASQKNLSDIFNSDSVYSLEDFLKTVIFYIDNNIEDVYSNNYYFNFTFDGYIYYIHKVIQKQEIEVELEMNNYEDLKSYCKFIIGENKKAKLNCQLNAEKHKEENTFTFKTLNIDTGEYNLEFANLYKANLKINNGTDYINNDTPIKKSKKDKAALIILCIIGGLIALGAIITLGYICFVRKNVDNKITNEVNPNSVADINDLSKYNQTSDNINN